MAEMEERPLAMARRWLVKPKGSIEATRYRGARVTLRGEFSSRKMDARAGRVRGGNRNSPLPTW